jgi:hypothetical protein
MQREVGRSFVIVDVIPRTFYLVPLKAMPSRGIIVTGNMARGVKSDLLRPSVGLQQELMQRCINLE